MKINLRKLYLLKKSNVLIKRNLYIFLFIIFVVVFLICLFQKYLYFLSINNFIYEKPSIWIWVNQANIQTVYFRKKIFISSPVLSGKFTLTADGKFELYINGKYVAQNNDWADVRHINVRQYLNSGENVIAIKVNKIRPDNGLIFLGKICFVTCQEIKSDTTWLASVNSSIKGWTEVKYNDSKWKKAIFQAEIDDAAWLGTRERFEYPKALPPNPIPAYLFTNFNNVLNLLGDKYKEFVNKNENPKYIYPKDVYQCNSIEALNNFKRLCLKEQYNEKTGTNVKNTTYFVIDFGKETFGNVEFDFGANYYKKFKLSSGEDSVQLLDSNLSLISSYEGEQEVFKEDFPRAFRYILFSSSERTGKYKLKIRSNFIAYPIANKGYFDSSDDLLNKIWNEGVYTTRLNMQDFYWDGIKRDRALWIGDFLEESMTNYYSFMDYSLVKKSLLNLSYYLGEDGQVRSQIGIGNANWDFTDYIAKWVTVLRNYYDYSGDINFVKSMSKIIDKQINYLSSKIDKNNLINVKKTISMPAYDWSSSTRYGEVTYQQAVFYKSLLDASYLKKQLGEDKEAKKYEDIAKKIKSSTNNLLYDKNFGAYRDFMVDGSLSNRFTQDSNVLSIEYGIASTDKAKSIINYLFNNLWTNEGSKLINEPYPDDAGVSVRNSISPTMNSYEAKILFENNQSDKAIELIKNTYASMVGYGNGTFWEFKSLSGKPETPGSSLAHGWSGNVAYIMSEEILGIKPVDAGFKTFIFNPHIANINWVRGAVPTPLGLIGISIDNANKLILFKAKITFPKVSKVNVIIPIRENGKVLSINGEVINNTDKKRKYHVSLSNLKFSQHYVSFTINEGGIYEILILK